MTQMISKTQAPVKRAGRIDPIAFFERFGVLIFMILLLIFFQSQNSNFFSERNIFNILTEVSIYGIMAVGMTFVDAPRDKCAHFREINGIAAAFQHLQKNYNPTASSFL